MAFNYEGRSIAPLMAYANNPIYQALRTEKGYFKNSSESISTLIYEIAKAI